MFQSLKSSVLLTFLKCYFTVITVFVMRDLFSQMELFTISPVRLWERKKGLWLTCSNPLHTWSDNSDQTGRFFLKIFHSRKKEVFTCRKTQKRATVTVYSWVYSGMCCPVPYLGQGCGGAHPSPWGMQVCIAQMWMRKILWFMRWLQWIVFILWLGKGASFVLFFFPKKGKRQKEMEMKRKQVNKCGFTETEGQFILSTASKNLENIWKSQKTS